MKRMLGGEVMTMFPDPRVDWFREFEQEREHHLRTQGEVIDLQSELQDLERKYKRLREYTQAAMRTLMHERRYGPTPGAPGTEANSEPFIQMSGKRTVNYGKKI